MTSPATIGDAGWPTLWHVSGSPGNIFSITVNLLQLDEKLPQFFLLQKGVFFHSTGNGRISIWKCPGKILYSKHLFTNSFSEYTSFFHDTAEL